MLRRKTKSLFKGLIVFLCFSFLYYYFVLQSDNGHTTIRKRDGVQFDYHGDSDRKLHIVEVCMKKRYVVVIKYINVVEHDNVLLNM